jgi:arginine repressor
MNEKLKKWLKKNRPNEKNKSCLSEYLEDIQILQNQGFTQLQILGFLGENGIQTSQQNLSRFIKTQESKKEINESKVKVEVVKKSNDTLNDTLSKMFEKHLKK